MSKILRRPMFRGGRVDSRGTGITSGLMDEGQIGGGTIQGKLMSDGRYGFAAPYPSNMAAFLAKQAGSLNKPVSTGLTTKLLPQSFLTGMEGLGTLTRSAAIPLSIAASPFFIFEENPLKDYPAEDELQTTAEKLQKEYFGQQRRKLMEDVMSGTRSEAKSPYTNFDTEAASREARAAEQKYFLQKDNKSPLRTSTEEDLTFATGMGEQKIKPPSPPPSSDETDIEDLLDEKKIKREADLYAKLLGGEEAKSQALYDALLAASPAFFKGKNLREAAPQVLESINKSGAFDKPRDIKQAAAQLAIQRRIAVETARAKSDDQLTRLEKQLAAKDTVLNKLSRIPGFSRDQFGGNLLKEPTPDQYPSIPPDKYFSIDGKIYASIGENIKDPKTGKIIKITTKFSPLG
jgi:hypothetical protein